MKKASSEQKLIQESVKYYKKHSKLGTEKSKTVEEERVSKR
jgi:hypothetical protein